LAGCQKAKAGATKGLARPEHPSATHGNPHLPPRLQHCCLLAAVVLPAAKGGTSYVQGGGQWGRAAPHRLALCKLKPLVLLSPTTGVVWQLQQAWVLCTQ